MPGSGTFSGSTDDEEASMQSAAQGADHEQAERMLARREGVVDAAERAQMLHEAVLLTMDLPEMVAQRYRGRGVDLEDLLQVARLALVKAAHGYESGRGSGFAAYAVPTITGEVKRHFRDHAWAVRPPRRLQELRAEAMVEEDRQRQRLRRQPMITEIADGLGMDCDLVRAALQCSLVYHTVPLEDPYGDPVGSVALAQGASSSDSVETRAALAWALRRLTSRERSIVSMRFVQELTQTEIGAALGISQMQVSRLLASILARLRADLLWSGQASDERAPRCRRSA